MKINFQIWHLLVAITIAGILVGVIAFVLSPFFRLTASIEVAQGRIVHEFDHAAIHDAAIKLLKCGSYGEIEAEDWPQEIAETQPRFIIVAERCVQNRIRRRLRTLRAHS